MNNEQSIPVQGTETKTLDIEQRKQLIEKLSAEYAGVKGRVGKLHAFLCDIDIKKKVPDYEERSNLREQLGIMLNYLENLRRRIGFHERMVFGQMINKTTHRIEIKGMREGRPIDRGIGVSCHHCGQDVSSESSQSSPSSENDQPVITGESIKKLMDYQVIGVCEPGFPCEGCVQDHYNTPCCKVELVGGYYLCLSPLPNSIITDLSKISDRDLLGFASACSEKHDVYEPCTEEEYNAADSMDQLFEYRREAIYSTGIMGIMRGAEPVGLMNEKGEIQL